MKQLNVVAVIFFLLFACCFSALAQTSKILLEDNTVIYGKVVAMSNGVYIVSTETMGELNINADKVLSISSVTNRQGAQEKSNGIDIIDYSKKIPPASNNNTSPNYDRSLQEKANTRVQSMTMDTNFIDSLMNLGENSQMTDIINDPEIMDAISRNDYEFLMQSDKMNDLMESNDIKSLLGDM